MAKLTVEDLGVKGKRVLMRVDFNVPLEGGKVGNDKRIRAAIPTIKYITEKGGRLILMSHLGRPKGERKPEMSLRPCVSVLSDLLGKRVSFVDDCIGDEAEAAYLGKEGAALLLVDAKDGQKLAEYDLESSPVFDGVIAAQGRIIISLENGSLVCFGK